MRARGGRAIHRGGTMSETGGADGPIGNEAELAERLLESYAAPGGAGSEAFERDHPELSSALRTLETRWRVERGADGGAGGPTRSGGFAELLRRHYGADVDPGISLEPAPTRPSAAAAGTRSKDLVERIGQPGGEAVRYELGGEIARGGMGAILEAWDPDLRRNLAMKVILSDRLVREDGDSVRSSVALTRFLEEAQITGQLEHPGVVPVHELGIDADGRVFFTMQLVRGRELRDVIERVHAGDPEWTLVRALGVVQRVCETMSYAHSRDVVHRDLKPSNVMVGRYGETYVMDWGLARVMGAADSKDIRPRPFDSGSGADSDVVRTDSRSRFGFGGGDDQPVLTMDGDVVGTPAYMPPEQAFGNVDDVGPLSDVYSIGAILYHLLTGQAPYVPRGSRMNSYAILAAVQSGPPPPPDQLAPELPAELAAVCRKAMAPDPAHRYPSCQALADDLRAFLEGRPVAAFDSGLGYVLRLAVKRNKGISATVLASTTVLVAATVAFIVSLQASLRAEQAERFRSTRLVGAASVAAWAPEVDELYPVAPATVPAMDEWTARLARLHADWQSFAPEREEALASGDAGLVAEIEAVERGLAELDALQLVVAARREEALRLPERTVEHPRWSEAIAGIAASERYRDANGDPLSIEPQLGLIPLGADPTTGLWEFWVYGTGAEPVRVDGDPPRLAVGGDTAVVLVLLPGDPDYVLGSADPTQDDKMRTCRVNLAPYFIGKYEVTQGQWERVMGTNPSTFRAESSTGEQRFDDAHPVEYVSWVDVATFCGRTLLELPTEAQWEHAARAGTRTVFWFGDDPRDARWCENVLDLSYTGLVGSIPAPWHDGFSNHAPVGSFAASPFGLHDVHGNVIEWCRDPAFESYGPDRTEPGDGLTSLVPDGGAPSERRIARGGSYYLPAGVGRSAFRQAQTTDVRQNHIGFRVARALRR